MLNRRTVLLGCGAMAGAMRVKGSKRPFCIDCQSHMFAPQLIAMMQKRKKPPYIYDKGNQRFLVVGEWHRPMLAMPLHVDVDLKLKTMDEAGIDMTALSINDPGPELFGSQGAEVAQICNDFIAGVVKRHPTRFLGLAVLPLQDMNASMAELDRCIGKLGMKGILLYSNIDGKFPDEPQFRDMFRRAEQLNVPILLHPPNPVTYAVTSGYKLTGGLGLMFDTTIAVARIILSGLMDEHPKLKLVCPHVGGTLPYLIGRIDHQMFVLKRAAGELKINRRPSEYLKNVYLDCVSALPQAIRFAYDMVGPDRFLYSSDHPWVDPKFIRSNLDSLNLPARDQEKVLSGTAKKLFGI